MTWTLQRLADLQVSTASTELKLEECQKAADNLCSNFEIGGSKPSSLAKLSLASNWILTRVPAALV